MAEQREKQANLLKALSDESALWVTAENLDEKISDALFEVAGRTTFTPTRRSRDWAYMALPHVPDFSAYADEDLFDEKEDVHFLTDKSPWRRGPGEALEVPEGHEVGWWGLAWFFCFELGVVIHLPVPSLCICMHVFGSVNIAR